MSSIRDKSLRASLAELGGQRSVDKSEDYRRRAALCVRMAAIITQQREKLAVIDMAQAWLDLADRADRNGDSDPGHDPVLPRQLDGEEAQ